MEGFDDERDEWWLIFISQSTISHLKLSVSPTYHLINNICLTTYHLTNLPSSYHLVIGWLVDRSISSHSRSDVSKSMGMRDEMVDHEMVDHETDMISFLS